MFLMVVQKFGTRHLKLLFEFNVVSYSYFSRHKLCSALVPLTLCFNFNLDSFLTSELYTYLKVPNPCHCLTTGGFGTVLIPLKMHH